MVRILIADDEPAAGRYLKALTEAAGPDFRVVAVACDGQEALDLVRTLGPDLVLTDIRMPVLDGLGLASRLKDEWPGLPAVIVSGHQEFEYARQALALGVLDYLLKPVDPQALSRLLTRLAEQIRSNSGSRTVADLEALLAGTPASGPIPPRFRVALVRWGGPVTRPVPGSGLAAGAEGPAGDHWVFPGRDEKEFLVLSDADRVTREAFEALVRNREPDRPCQTRTILFPDKPAAAGDLAETVRDLGPQLDRVLVPGRTKTHWGPVRETPVETLDPLWTQKVRWALQESAWHRLETLVRGLAADWDRNQRPGRQAAGLVRQLLLLAQQDGPGGKDLARDWEFQFEEALGRVDDYGALADLVWGLFAGIAGLGPEPTGPTDAPETHQRIRRFVQTHFAEPLSIPMVCDRFQISQTSLSKLFRKYENKTFHEYLTDLRLDAAEQLLKDAPGLPLKTVASSVGYLDPFHFSRAFKAAKGRSPSQKAADH